MKLGYTLLAQPNMARLSNAAMRLLLLCVKRQDEFGYAKGIHYSDFIKEYGMSKQSFYNGLAELEIKGLIKYKRINDGAYYNIFVKYNDFSNKQADFKNGYIKLKKSVFHKKSFKKLKSHEMYLVFYFMKRTHENSSSFKILPKNLYKMLTALLGVTERIIRSYLHTLKKFFSIGIAHGKYYITYKSSSLNPEQPEAERFYTDKAFIMYLVRKHKIRNVSAEEIDVVANFPYQWKQIAKEKGKNIKTVIDDVIKYLLINVKQKDRNLPFKLINKTISEYLNGKSSIVAEVDTISDKLQNSDGSYNVKVIERLVLNI